MSKEKKDQEIGFAPEEFSADEEIIQAVGQIAHIQIGERVYKVGASALADLPTLNRKVEKITKLIDKSDEMGLLKDEVAQTLMAEIMYEGVKNHNPGITKEYIKNNFGLAAFPYIFRAMLDLNEYLIGMQQIQGDSDAAAQLKKKSKNS